MKAGGPLLTLAVFATANSKSRNWILTTSAWRIAIDRSVRRSISTAPDCFDRGRFFQRANPYRSTRRGETGWIAFRGAVETAGLQTRNVNWKH
jgi:hypothetical protein